MKRYKFYLDMHPSFSEQRYVVVDGKQGKYGPTSTRLMYAANRAWKYCVDTGEVKYAKNRWEGLNAEVDMKEFFLVQIAAVPRSNEL